MILHITTRAEWEQSQTDGEYRAPSLKTEGFIHCSSPGQVLAVVNAFYSQVPDLVLLWIDPEKVAADILWEAPTMSDPQPDELFPHIYGPLNIDAVEKVLAFRPDADGIYRQVPGG